MSFGCLLISEPPLTVLPTLAVLVGLNEAIALQQVHYWLTNISRDASKKETHFRDGQWWVYNTYEDWQVKNFPFWSVPTIRRAFNGLEKKGLLLSAQYGKKHGDCRKWYAIDRDAVDALMTPSDQNDQTPCDRPTPSDQNDQTLGSDRSDPLIKMIAPYIEKETTKETNKEIKPPNPLERGNGVCDSENLSQETGDRNNASLSEEPKQSGKAKKKKSSARRKSRKLEPIEAVLADFNDRLAAGEFPELAANHEKQQEFVEVLCQVNEERRIGKLGNSGVAHEVLDHLSDLERCKFINFVTWYTEKIWEPYADEHRKVSTAEASKSWKKLLDSDCKGHGYEAFRQACGKYRAACDRSTNGVIGLKDIQRFIFPGKNAEALWEPWVSDAKPQGSADAFLPAPKPSGTRQVCTVDNPPERFTSPEMEAAWREHDKRRAEATPKASAPRDGPKPLAKAFNGLGLKRASELMTPTEAQQ